jgi:hypothetical protein
MAEFDDAVRLLSALLKDVGGTETPGPVVVGPGEDALAEAVGLVKETAGAAAVSSASGSGGGSLARSVLGVLSSNLLEGSVAGQIASAVSGDTQKQSSTLSTVLGFLGKGLGIVPAISAIFRLFGGGGEDEPVALPKYVAPPALHLDAANSAGAGTGLAFDAVRYAAGNLPGTRDIPSLTLRAREYGVPVDGSTDNPSLTLRAQEQSASPAQVVVQVNAMDSRSFMDHSDDIARAVREAILNMHPLTDAVSEL